MGSNRLTAFLFQPADVSPLVFFRIVFGLLMAVESIGAILIGFVHEAYIEPRFHFSYFSFDWLAPLPGQGMVWLYAFMAVVSLMIMIGWWYKTACLLFFICFSYGFLIEKAHYINHHYLAILLGFLMIFLPANRYFSIDARINSSLKTPSIPYWPIFLLIFTMSVVYFYGGIAKLNPEWLEAKPLKHWFGAKGDYFLIGPLLAHDAAPWLFAYGGLVFDLFIVPAMIWKRSRNVAFFAAILFNFLNLVVFQIGIFPFMAVALTGLFYPSGSFRRWMFPNTPSTDFDNKMPFAGSRSAIPFFCGFWILLQVLAPIRPYVYNQDPQWTEQGHRFSWRMMLRAKSGHITFYVDKKDGTSKKVKPKEYLTAQQTSRLPGRPDMIYQMAHFLEEHFREKGMEIEAIRARGTLRLNGAKPRPFVDAEVDITAEPWQHFSLPDWLIRRE